MGTFLHHLWTAAEMPLLVLSVFVGMYFATGCHHERD
jgi:hypothetical protein